MKGRDYSIVLPTEYKGVTFRSRLEARWAVFFDQCGDEWVYEPEGYQLASDCFYLPDFAVYGEFLEVKPREDWEAIHTSLSTGKGQVDTIYKASLLSIRTGKHVNLVCGDPVNADCVLFCPHVGTNQEPAWLRDNPGTFEFTFMHGPGCDDSPPDIREAAAFARGFRFWDPKRSVA